MIQVNITRGSFALNSKRLKQTIIKTLEENGIVSDAVVDVAIVGKAKMDELNKKYYKDEIYEHPIFTFPEGLTEDKGEAFTMPPDNKIHLGQMVISYPYVVEIANEKNKLIDDVIGELAEHGCLHLVGIHH